VLCKILAAIADSPWCIAVTRAKRTEAMPHRFADETTIEEKE
jgi:hypothetical protein